jgi:hypothetical protein
MKNHQKPQKEQIEPGAHIIIGNAQHSGLKPGVKGQIIARHPAGGYAVEVERVLHVKLFGGATVAETATVYLEDHEFTLDQTIVDDSKISQK